MAGTWDFCLKTLVVENLPPQQGGGMSMNGWSFSSKPNVPYQYIFKVTVQDLRWYLQSNGLYDNTTDTTRNARRFEEFVRTNGNWDAFDFPHPHLGTIKCKFKNLPAVPKAIPNSGGLIDAFEVELIHDNPAF